MPRGGGGEGAALAFSRASAKAAAMGWTVVGAGEPGVPAGGTPRSGNVAPAVGGSILPGFAASRQLVDDEDLFRDMIARQAVLSPPYLPEHLIAAVEESDTLPTAIDAMAVNISGFGYELEPLFETAAEAGTRTPIPAPAAAERAELDLFFATCSIGVGLCGLFDAADRDVETIGYGGFEVLRDETGRVAALEHLPSRRVRYARRADWVPVATPVRDPTTGKVLVVTKWRRFRPMVQITDDGRTAWFKPFGDPRHLNVRTGQYAPWKVDGMNLDPGEPWGLDSTGYSLDASEYVMRNAHTRSGTPYGIPRWVGASPDVKAGRLAAELPGTYLEHAPIGLLLLLLAGGTWKPGELEKVAEAIRSRKGAKNAFEILGVEADTDVSVDLATEGTSTQAPRISLEAAAPKLETTLYAGGDSLRGMTKRHVRQMFRLGAVYYGDSEAESNRAAADTARAIGEEQVFRPIRAARWERWINEELFPSMGAVYWTFRLRGAPVANADGAAQNIDKIGAAGGVTPNAAARLLAELTNTEAYEWSEPWADRPMAITLALLQAGIDPSLPLAEAAAAFAQAKAVGVAPGGAPAPGGDVEVDEDGNPIETPPAAAGAVVERLNGAQIAAVVRVAEAIAKGVLFERNGVELLAYAVGMPREVAQAMLDGLEALAAEAKAVADAGAAAADAAVGALEDAGAAPDPDAPPAKAKPARTAKRAEAETIREVLDGIRDAAAAVGLEQLRGRIAKALRDGEVAALPERLLSTVSA